MIEIVETEEKFAALKPIWRKLELGPRMRIFQTFDWCWTAWNVYLKSSGSNRLWIVLWFQEGRSEQVIFPFYIDEAGRLRYIMDTHSDVLDVVYDKDVNYHYAFREVADAILENNSVRSVLLQKMDGESLSLSYLGVLLPGAFSYRDNAYSFITANKSENIIGSLSHLRQKDRSRLKAINKKGSALTFNIYSKKTNDAFPKEGILALRKVLLCSTARTIGFLPDVLIDFIAKLYEAGKCEIPVLCDGQDIKALAFRLLHGKRIMHWIVLYDDHHLTTELYVKYMSAKVTQTDCIFDFGVGAYGYKLGTFRPITANTYSLRYEKSCWRQLKAMLSMNWRVTKDFLKARGFGRHG